MKIQDILEGPHDPHTYKAVFMLGGPGSGKSFVADQLAGGTGLRTVNIDQFYEQITKYLADEGIAGSHVDISDLYQYAWKKTAKRRQLFIDRGLGLLIDMTGRNMDFVINDVAMLKNHGYDVMGVYVDTNVKTALDRAEQRKRKVSNPDVVYYHSQVRGNIPALKQLFGKNWITVDNTPRWGIVSRGTNELDVPVYFRTQFEAEEHVEDHDDLFWHDVEVKDFSDSDWPEEYVEIKQFLDKPLPRVSTRNIAS